jgi:hypothetical protein
VGRKNKPARPFSCALYARAEKIEGDDEHAIPCIMQAAVRHAMTAWIAWLETGSIAAI